MEQNAQIIYLHRFLLHIFGFNFLKNKIKKRAIHKDVIKKYRF